MRNKILIPLVLFSLFLAGCASAQMGQPERAITSEDTGGGFVAESEAPAAEPQDGFEEEMSEDRAGVQERIVIKNANISIAVASPERKMDDIAQMAESMGGFVVSSNLYHTQLDTGQEVPRANVTVRVPAERLNEALKQIETGVGQVLSKNISGEDVTRE